MRDRTLALGSNSITVVYGSDSHFAPSTSTALTQTVSRDSTTTVLLSSVNPSIFGQTVIFTAVVIPASPGSGTPTGKVTFYDGTIPLGPAVPLTDGMASFQSSTLSVATHTIKAVYGGDTDFTGSSFSLSQVVGVGGDVIIAQGATSSGQGFAALTADAMEGSLIQDLALEQVSTQHLGRRLGDRQPESRTLEATAMSAYDSR